MTRKLTHAEELVIVFTRYPEPGKTKTRLIPALGARGAADLQRKMTEQAVNTVKKLSSQRRNSLEVRFEGGTVREMQQWLDGQILYRPQGGGNLGRRLQQAFADAFASGFHKVVAIGADCPSLSAKVISSAIEMLEDATLVLGPAKDGGYYLVGLNRPAPELFAAISWGSDNVLEQTLACARKLDLTTALLDTLSDVDRPEDLHDFNHYTGSE